MYQIEKRKIRLDEYQQIRSTTNWVSLDDDVVRNALENDLFSVCVMHQNQTIGIGRIIGDDGIYYYIQDVIVHPDHQGKGVGALIMDEIECYLKSFASVNAFIGLMAAVEVAEFYTKFGYQNRPDNAPGMYKLNKRRN